MLGVAIGSRSLRRAGQNTFEQNAQAAQANAPLVNSLTQIHNVDSFINYSLGKVGELVPFAASLAVGGAAGRALGGAAGQFAGITGVSGAIQGGQTFEAAKAAGATPREALAPAAVSGLGQGALDAVLGAEFAKNLQGRIANVPGQAALGAGVNAAQTVAQQGAVSYATGKPHYNAKDVLNAAAGGAIGGGLIGGVTSVLGRGIRLRRTDTTAAVPPARGELVKLVGQAPTAASHVPDLSAEDLANLTTQEPGGRIFINKAYVKQSTSELLAGKKFEGNSLTRAVGKLNAREDGYEYKTVSLKQMVKEKAVQKFSTPAERITYMRSQAYEKFNEAVAKNRAFVRIFDPANPEAFLNNFEVIQKNSIPPALRAGSSLDLTPEDIQHTLRTPAHAKDTRRGEFTVLENEKPRRINAMDLTIAGMKRTAATGATVTPHRAAEAFFTGLTSLLEKNPRSGKADISLPAKGIPKDTIVFTPRHGEPITYGDLTPHEKTPNDAVIREARRGFVTAKEQLAQQRKAGLAKESLTPPEKEMGHEGEVFAEPVVTAPATEAENQLANNQRLEEQAKAIRATNNKAEIRRIYRQALGKDPSEKVLALPFKKVREFLANHILRERVPVARGLVAPARELTDLQTLAEKLGAIKGIRSLSELRAKFKELTGKEGTTSDNMISRLNDAVLSKELGPVERIQYYVLRKALVNRQMSNPVSIKEAYKLYRSVTGEDPSGIAPKELLDRVEKRIEAFKQTHPESPARFYAEPLARNPKVAHDNALRSLDYSLQFTTNRDTASRLYKSVTGEDAKNLTIAQMRQKALADISPISNALKDMINVAKNPGKEVDIMPKFGPVKPGFRAPRVEPTPQGSKISYGQMTFVKALEEEPDDATDRGTPNTFSMAAPGTKGLGKIGFEDLVRRGKPDPILQERAAKLSKELGLPASIKVVSAEDFLLDAPEKLTGALNGTLFGATHDAKNGVLNIFIHPNLKGAARDEVFAHEFGHAVLASKLLSMSDGEARALIAEYKTWKGSVKTIGDVISSLKIGESKKLLARALDNRISRELGGDKASNYLTSFPEWFADKTAKWIIEKPLEPKTVTERFFAGVGKAIRLLANRLRPGTAVEDYLSSLVARSGRWELPISAIEALRALHVPGAENSVLAAGSEGSVPGSLEHAELTKDLFLTQLTSEERRALGQAAMSLPAQRQFSELFKTDPAMLDKVRTDPLEAVLAAYPLWRVGKMRFGPAAGKIYGNFRQEMLDRFGKLTNDQKAADTFSAIRSGLIALRDTSPGKTEVGRIVNATRLTRMVKLSTDTYSHIAPVFQTVFSSASDRLIKTNNPYLAKLANMIEVRVGTENQREGMFAARGRHIAQFDNQIRTAFEGKTAAFGEQTLEALQNPSLKITDPEIRQAVAHIRAILGNTRKYVKATGVYIGDKGSTYFPWVFDTEYMMSHQDEFIKLISQDKYKEETKSTPQMIVNQILPHGGYADIKPRDPQSQLIPGMNAVNVRELSWIQELGNAKDHAELAKFFDKDLGHTLRVYGEQAIKRAEFARRFGPKGGKLTNLLLQAKRFGAAPRDLQLARDYMESVMGIAGMRTRNRLYDALNLLPDKVVNALDIKPPKPGEPINRKLQKAMGIVMVYQNIRILGLATLSSISDPIGILLRSGEAGIAWKAFRGGLVDTYQNARGDKTALRSLGDMLGVIDEHMTMEALGQEWGGVHLTGKARRVNEGFFKWMGLSGWTRMTRMMGLIGAEHFLLRHGLKPNAQSERFLAQLNVKGSDIRARSDGSLKVLTPEERSLATPEGREADTRVKIALNRFVDEAILRPTAAQRPLWASDPHFQLVFHMKSFTYAFTTRILARILSEAEEGNLTPLMQASMFIPAMVGAQLLRGVVTTGGIPEQQKNWGVIDYMAEAANRQNLYGLGSFGVDAATDMKYGGLGVASFLGPTLSQAAQIPPMLLGNVHDLQHAMPLSNVWRHW